MAVSISVTGRRLAISSVTGSFSPIELPRSPVKTVRAK